MNLANLSEKIKNIFLHDFFSSLNSELKTATPNSYQILVK